MLIFTRKKIVFKAFEDNFLTYSYHLTNKNLLDSYTVLVLIKKMCSLYRTSLRKENKNCKSDNVTGYCAQTPQVYETHFYKLLKEKINTVYLRGSTTINVILCHLIMKNI